MTVLEAIQHKPHPLTYTCMNLTHISSVVTIENIEVAACELYKVEASTLKGKNRHAQVLKVRQIIMYLCRKLTNLSHKEIGKHFGGFNHATVINAVQRVQDLMDTEPAYKHDVTKLLQYFGRKTNRA